MAVAPFASLKSLVSSDQEWQQLDESGMITYDLTSDEVSQALVLKKAYPALSANDCFCFVPATAQIGLLVTGDAHNSGKWLRNTIWQYMAYFGWLMNLTTRNRVQGQS